jgi:hypothetical protein
VYGGRQPCQEATLPRVVVTVCETSQQAGMGVGGWGEGVEGGRLGCLVDG